MPTLRLFFLLLSCLHVFSCDRVERESLVSFYEYITPPPANPLNWSSTNCCQWEGINCDLNSRVIGLTLSGRGLSGGISPSLGNLSYLSYLNLSQNHLSGPLPIGFFQTLDHLKTLDLSYNRLTGLVQNQLEPTNSSDCLPVSAITIDLSSNLFNGSIDTSFLERASNLVSFNVSNNTFSGSFPWSVCTGSGLIEILDFSINKFSGPISPEIGECSKLQVLRAGRNLLSGIIPYNLYTIQTLREIYLPNNNISGTINRSIVMLSNLSIIELNDNRLIGELPGDIGRLSNLQQLILHTNSLNGSLPPSLADCTNLTSLLLRNNHLEGEISALDFSNLRKLAVIDLGNNSFVGQIPPSLCLCRALTAVRLAYNKLEGEVPACFAALTSLAHLSLSDNKLSNVVGALRTLVNCRNLSVLFLSRCFINEMVIDDHSLMRPNGFENLEILTLGGSRIKGEIPSWISQMKKLKVLNFAFNQMSGPIPTWIGSMPNLFILNLTKNSLSGDIPREIGNLQALVEDDSDSDLSSLALPFLFNSQQYNRLFNLPRSIKLGSNDLSGHIPPEIGRLKLLLELDLNNNELEGSIPRQLSGLMNLEVLDMSNNHLSGEIPLSLAALNFLSSFSVANNSLEGEIPRGGQFETFSASSFEGNPKLCGNIVQKICPDVTQVDTATEEDFDETSWYHIPFGVGYFVGFLVVSITMLLCSSFRSSKSNNDPESMSTTTRNSFIQWIV